MKKYSKALVNLTLAVVILLGIVFLLPKAFMFFMPFVVGWIISLIASPLVRFCEEKIKLKRKIGSAFVIIAVIALVVLLLYSLIAWLIEQVGGLLASLPDMWAGLETDLSSMGERLDVLLAKLPEGFRTDLDSIVAGVVGRLGSLVEQLSTPTIEVAGRVVAQLPTLFIATIMALLSAYFFVAERQQLGEWFRKHTPPVLQRYYDLIRKNLAHSVGGYLKAQLKIEVWMYVLLLIGMFVLKVDYYALIALIIAILDFLPFLGTGTVLIPWAVIKIFASDYELAVGLLIIWCVGQLARNLIQPKIVGDSIGVPPLPTLLLLYIGYQVGGVVGMIIAVPLGLLVYSMYQEGIFDGTRDSFLILLAGVNRFRQLHKEDMLEVEEMRMRNEEEARKLEEQRQADEEARQAEMAAAKAAKKTRKEKKK